MSSTDIPVPSTTQPLIKTEPTTPPVEHAAQDEQQRASFLDYYIDDNAPRDEAPAPPLLAFTATPNKRRGTKRAADSDEVQEKITPAKRLKATMNTSDESEYTPHRRSDRIKKRGAEPDIDEPESPLAKRPKMMATGTANSSKGKGKAPTFDTPPSKRAPGITKQLHSERRYPKKHMPSSELVKHQRPETESEDEVAPKKRRSNGNKKAVPDAIIPTDFVGTHTGMGTSAEKPANAKLDKPWSCAHRNCSSGMTWYPRDGKASEGMGRKAISQFFGRNKKETRYIDTEVWHTYCRKDYQRLYYKSVRTTNGSFNWHMRNLKQQLVRLKLWRPGAKFRVEISKNQLKRNAEWHRILRAHDNDKDAAQSAYDRHPDFGIKELANKRGGSREMKEEEAFPVDHTDQFERDVCGDDADYDRIDEILEHIQSLLEDGTLTRMAPIEYLIHEVEDGETVTDTRSNYARWVAKCDEYDFRTPDLSDEDDMEIKEEEESGSEIRVAGVDEEYDEADDSRDTLIDAVDASPDAEDEKPQESEAESDIVEATETTRAFTPVNHSYRKPFKLFPTMPGVSARRSSTFGVRKATSRRGWLQGDEEGA